MRAYLRELQAPGALSWRTAADLTRPLARWPQPLRPGHGAGPAQCALTFQDPVSPRP